MSTPGPWLTDVPPDEARSLLRRELLRPEYQERDLLGRLLRWFDRQLVGLVDAAGSVTPLTVLAAMVTFALLLTALLWLLSRLRGARRAAVAEGAVLTGERVSAAELRVRARAALGEDRFDDAVVEGFRTLVLQQVEDGALPDAPGATAHEVAQALEEAHARHAAAIGAAAGWFDEVRYGDHAATRAQAESVLALDGDLSRVR